MRASKARFVTACQQLLALAVVVTALTPAASVVDLDVVSTVPASAPVAAAGPTAGVSSSEGVGDEPAPVATAPVDPHVAEIQLTAPAVQGSTARRSSRAPQAQSSSIGADRTRVVSRPQPIVGFGAVGVTWDPARQVPEGGIALQARTRAQGSDGGRWSGWTDIAYHADHGPDPGSAEARRSRPGSEPLLVGRVDQVQVRATAKGTAPDDMQLAVIDPGRTVVSQRQAPAIDTAALSGATEPTADESATQSGTPSGTQSTAPSGTDAATGAPATAYTPMPTIFSRAQWGADESIRDSSSLRYYEVHAGFVHHTVNSNDYTREDVPAIIRGIYAYHTRSRGWSDIGYNFLVDRFGGVWEGRYGGVDRPVVGAHTLGYNDYSFAMSAIGNYDQVQPSDAVLRAYGSVFAWKLSLHGVSAASTSQPVGRGTFQAINGHRDAGLTACPGKYLYAQLPTIRSYAAAGQIGWEGRDRQTSLAAGPQPDLIVRRARNGHGLVIPTTASGLGDPIDTGVNFGGVNALLNVGDWDRDGANDVVARATDGTMLLYRGNGQGRLNEGVSLGVNLKGVRLLAAVGDVTGDGWPDLMGQPRKSSMRIYPGSGSGIAASYSAYPKIKGSRQVGVGRMDGDGAPDVVVRRKKNLVVYPGNGPGGLTTGAANARGRLKGFDWVIGAGDVNGDGHGDVLLRRKSSGKLFLLVGSERRFAKPKKFGTGMKAYNLAG